MFSLRSVFATAVMISLASPALADRQTAIDACIERLLDVGGPDMQNGREVLSAESVEAGVLVMLRDAGGTVWSCVGHDDGTAGEPAVVDAADDGGGAMDGASGHGGAIVHFAPGSTGATIRGSITGGDVFDHVLGARTGQTLKASLRVRRTDGDGVIYFNILPPSGGSGEALYAGSMEAEPSAAVKLPVNGNYTIRVYLMGNDRDEGKTVDYAIDVSVR